MSQKTIETITKALKTNSKNTKGHYTYYNYIPAREDHIINTYKIAIKRIEEKKKNKNIKTYPDGSSYIRVLDVGSGIGGALLTMRITEKITKKNKHIFYRYNGLEIDPNLIPIARQLLNNGWDETTINLGNALTFKDYNYYDIIYYYHPIESKSLQKKLELKIEKDTKIGTIIIAILKEDCPRSKRCKVNIKNWKILYDDYDRGIVMEKIR